MSQLRDQWPWNESFLKLMLIGPSTIGVLATALTYPIAGAHALWFLSAAIFGIVMYLVFGHVGKRVQTLYEELNTEAGEQAEALIVIGKIQSPGVVKLQKSNLIIAPIAGEQLRLPLASIKTITARRWLPGKYLWGKTALYLTLDEEAIKAFNKTGQNKMPKNIAFGIADSFAKRWQLKLSGS